MRTSTIHPHIALTQYPTPRFSSLLLLSIPGGGVIEHGIVCGGWNRASGSWFGNRHRQQSAHGTCITSNHRLHASTKLVWKNLQMSLARTEQMRIAVAC